MYNTVSLEELGRLAAAGDAAAVEAHLAATLPEHHLDPALCHFAGLYYYWRALRAEQDHDADRADACWNMALPHLVYALEDEAYLDRFRDARMQSYALPAGAPVPAGADARAAVYRHVDQQLESVRDAYAAADDKANRERVFRTIDRWRLERLAAPLVRSIGGVTNGRAPATGVVAGPAFARLYDFYDGARAQIEKIPVREMSLDEQIAALLNQRSPVRAGEISPEMKREVGYCFSPLDMAFLYSREKQFGRALEFLRHLFEAGGKGGGPSELAGEAEIIREDARQLAIGIRLAVGTDCIHRDRAEMRQGLAYWAEALKDADVLDARAASVMQHQGGQIRQRMLDTVQQRAMALIQNDRWEDAVEMLEGVVDIIPTEETLAALVNLLHRRAIHVCNTNNDFRQGLHLLRRARLLAPREPIVANTLLQVMARCTHDTMEAGRHREATDACLEMLSLSREIIAAHGDEEATKKMQHLCGGWLLHMLPQLDKEKDEDLLRNSVAALQHVAGGGENVDIDRVQAFRHARQAFELFKTGAYDEAYRDADEALRHAPGEEQIQQLYDAVAERAVDLLCDRGELDRAWDLAQKAFRTRGPQSSGIRRCRARVLLRRLDPQKVCSENPEDIAVLVMLVQNQVPKDPADEAIQQKARKFGAILDPKIQNERKLNRVNQLISARRPREALELLGSLRLEGRDSIWAGHLEALCHYHMGRLDRALEVADRLVADYPLFPFVRKNRGRLLSYAGRFAEAEEDLMAYREADENDYDIVHEIAMNAFRAGNYQDAIANFRLARRHGNDSFQGVMVECMDLMRQGRTGEIPKTLENLSEKRRKDPDLRLSIEWISGTIDDEECLRRAHLKADPKGGTYFWLGLKLRLAGDRARGHALIRRCLELGHTEIYEYEHALAMKNSGQLED